MPAINVKKKIEKKAPGLGITEPVVAACTTNPSGTMTGMLARELGGVAGAAIAAKAGGTSEDPATGAAGRFPTGKHFLVLTEQRLLLTGVSTWTGSPTAIVAEWLRAEVQDISVESGRLADRLTIAFTDGTGAQVEGAKGTDPGSVARAFAD
ncbi:MAG: hypothetical protein AAF531_25725 [Actinomycetota bacterium]